MLTRVLVVEDNPADFRLLQEVLLDVGAYDTTLVRADMLEKAVAALAAGSFDVALLDLSLPDTDGLNGFQRLQQAAPELPIVVLTGRDDSDLAMRAVREGAQDYLVKGQVDGHLLLRAMQYADERKRAVRELQASKERFRSLLENASDIIAVLDAEGLVTYASPSVERMLGYKPEDLVGRAVASIIHPADAEMIRQALATFAPGTSKPIECRVRCADGTVVVLEAIGRNLLDDPIVQGVIVNARDVTGRKESAERLRAANERLRTVISTSPLAIYVTDLDGRVLDWNKAAENIFQWTQAEVIGRELPVIRPQSRAELQNLLHQIRQGKSAGPVESRYLRKGGAPAEVTIWASALGTGAGDVNGAVFLVADVTEHRRLEDQFRQAQKMEAIGRLAGGVAHDFNNLLTVITGYSQLALTRIAPDSPASVELREVIQAADRAATLTRQLLTLSRRQVVEPEILDINTVVADTQRMLHRVIGENIRLVTRLSPSIQRIRADRGQLELVLLNMVVNARDAMPNGGQVSIETSNVQLENEDVPARRIADMHGPCVMLAISDTGVGMDAQVRAQIFEPFFTTKEAGKGTGLGLSTSYGIVRQHGGDIWVYSEVGVGTTFKIYFPVVRSQDLPAPSKLPSERERRGTETILIVEDDPGVANVMRQGLERHGYQVLLSSEPKGALDLVARHPGPIHLLLTDMVLPTEHGVDLARQVGALRSGIRILIVSGYTGPSGPGQPALESGVAFLQKPFSPDVLAAKVREVLNADSQQAT